MSRLQAPQAVNTLAWLIDITLSGLLVCYDKTNAKMIFGLTKETHRPNFPVVSLRVPDLVIHDTRHWVSCTTRCVIPRNVILNNVIVDPRHAHLSDTGL